MCMGKDDLADTVQMLGFFKRKTFKKVPYQRFLMLSWYEKEQPLVD